MHLFLISCIQDMEIKSSDEVHAKKPTGEGLSEILFLDINAHLR